ncbi:interferon alpha/beta receptor 2-like [Sphaeramia orbicularis]|uniref:Interferon alpha/beta receptor 2-like n=1 Tax=Sphaeramia orbicularis TaxID=375764 RepID=A0A672Y7B4_9TELE|nr:interferon alpha/beta receptor 2-like [Sphaeramia orbicularis]
MGLWILLLLPFHLVVCVSLPSPSNVSISSFNMEHILSFRPGPGTPSDARFIVQTLRFRRNSWKAVSSCLELMAGQSCNLTSAFKDPFEYYLARVQAFTRTQTSNWAVSTRFYPLSDTFLGPPEVSVSGCGNCLILQVSVPTLKNQQHLDLHRELIVNVRRTRDGIQFRLTLPYKEESVITYLQRGVEYCVTVAVTSFSNSNFLPSKPYCAFTSPPPSKSSVYIVFSLLGAFSVLGLVLIGSVVYGGQLRFKLFGQRSPRSLSYILLQGQSRESVELSDRISVTDLHKEDSTARPQISSTSEERLEDWRGRIKTVAKSDV